MRFIRKLFPLYLIYFGGAGTTTSLLVSANQTGGAALDDMQSGEKI